MEENKMKRQGWLLEVLAASALALFWVLGLAFKSIGALAQKAGALADMAQQKPKSSGQVLDSLGVQSRDAKAGRAREFEVSGRILSDASQTTEFEVADRIVGIRLDPEVGVVHLRIYYDKRVVKREMIVTEPKLRVLLRGRRHALPDAVYDPKVGLQELKKEAVKQAEELINRVGNQNSGQARQKVQMAGADKVPAKAEGKPVAKAAAQVAAKVDVKAPEAPVKAEPKAQPTQAPVAIPAAPAVQEKRFDARPMVGTTFEGILVKAANERVTPPGRAPYETFEARLRLDNGMDLPLRGNELERELSSLEAQLGQRFAITPLGKVPVTLPTGKEGSKNMYRVVRI